MSFTVKNWVGSFILFTVLTVLLIGYYQGIEDGYGIIKGDQQFSNVTNSTGNIVDQFQEMNLIEGVTEINAAIEKIGNPGSTFDLLGGLAAIGLGVLKTILGLITAPISIASIIGTFYFGQIPGIILAGVVALTMVLIAFKLLEAYVRSEV